VAGGHARVLTEAGAPLVGAGLEVPYVWISLAIPGGAFSVNCSSSRSCHDRFANFWMRDELRSHTTIAFPRTLIELPHHGTEKWTDHSLQRNNELTFNHKVHVIFYTSTLDHRVVGLLP
jgi:hypothetical protein